MSFMSETAGFSLAVLFQDRDRDITAHFRRYRALFISRQTFMSSGIPFRVKYTSILSEMPLPNT